MILIFVVQTGERFAEIFVAMTNAVAIDHEPQMPAEPNYGYALLHTVIVLLFAILFFNMFVGVVIEVYKREQETLTGSQMLKRRSE